MSVRELIGTVDNIGHDMVRIKVDDDGLAFIPRSAFPTDGKVGSRLIVTIKKTGPDDTEQWEVRLLKPHEYHMTRGADFLKDDTKK